MSDEPPFDAAPTALPTRAGEPEAPVVPAVAGPQCPWCSATLADPLPERCPACGARLVEDTSSEIPGVTTIDPAVLRAAAAPPQKRGMFGVSGRPAGTPPSPSVAPSSLDALAPPSPEVLAEMRRLREELDAAAAAEAADAAAAAEVAAAEGGAVEPGEGAGRAPLISAPTEGEASAAADRPGVGKHDAGRDPA